MSGTVSAVLVRPIVMQLLARPDGLAAFYRATDLTPEIVADQDARITPAQFCVAWAELVKWTEDPEIALKMALATPPGAFGVVEYLCRSAPTLGDALRHWVRYLNILDDAVEVALLEEGDAVCLRVVAESEAPAPASHELCFALLCAQAKAICQHRVTPTRVEFTHPGDATSYVRFFESPVTFRAAETQLVLPRAAMGAPLVSADPTLFGVLARAADGEQEKAASVRQRTDVLSAQVRRTLQKALREGAAEVDDVAKRLGLSGRSLQRRLKDEGTSFQTLREETRRDLARSYLEQGLSSSEISFLLGFSEPSAFFRAFKRWTGQTPFKARATVGSLVKA